MTQRIVIAGASGFIGRTLQAHFADVRGWEVVTIGRADAVRWGDATAIRSAVDGASLVVNLAGKSVNCRYSAANRAEIVRSRVDTTRQLADAIAAVERPPALWVNSSTATIYRHAMDRPQTESSGELGDGFSVSVARAWEDAFFSAELPATRRVALRMAIVLGDGSALEPLAALTRAGLGGAQRDGVWFRSTRRRAAGTEHRPGSSGGRQKFSWVHVDDVVRVVDWVSERADIEGVLNVASPHPEDNRRLMAHLRRILHRPTGLPMFRWMLELGSIAIRTETELVLKSRWVLPERLMAEGFTFAHADLEKALASILAPR
ncbi:hypothetical protein EV141_0044 [Microcella putealis]|uniref:DUF1731 domain-containing protein n=1 Tax=Microcella putealis TaxID=337005 RepID=A0A4Q7LUP3_9MICO|nr:DUF1731 domain-containing protein [Microcella putealis]RZS58836.1 hypothetical protein EV141_0044 [Microcella putealis]TQM23862.1 hypothetical protein BJ957_1323 [Microcella putealis]